MSNLIENPGIYPNITTSEYFSDPTPSPAISNHLIGKIVDKTAKHAWASHPKLGQLPEQKKSTVATYRGSLVHRLALGKGQDFAISPYDEFRTNEAKAWKQSALDRDIIPVKQKDYDAAKAMADIAEQAIEEVVEGNEYETEVVFAWVEETPHGPVWAKGMADIWCPALQLIVDLKTCVSASDKSVDGAFSKYGYGRQSTWYPRGFDAILGTPGETRFKDLFIETDYPYCTRTANGSEGYKSGATQEIETALNIWGECLKTGEWPGYDHRVVTPKPWDVQQWLAQGYDVEVEEY